MRFARDEWVQERASWRTVLQLNLVQSVNKILAALQHALDDNDVEEDPIPFSDKHNSLRLRPLTSVEGHLKRLLGIKAEDVLGRSRNWRNLLQASRLDGVENSHETIKHDSLSRQDVTEVIANCKNDIIELWEDHVIREMLQRECIHLGDSGSLSVWFPFRFDASFLSPT